MGPNPEVCAAHESLVMLLEERFKGFEKKLDENSKKLEKLLSRSERATTSDAVADTEIRNLKESKEKLWNTIDGLRKTVWIGVGVAISLSILIPMLIPMLSKALSGK